MAWLKNNWQLLLSIYIAFVFLQSLFFKFAELLGQPADITVYIFATVGTWIGSIGLPALGDAFGAYGGIVIGLAELVASIFLFKASTRFYGAVIALGVMSGAIFFHIFTPLGLYPYTDLQCLEPGCPQEYALFYMAVGVWVCAAVLAWVNRGTLLGPKTVAAV
jgi:hypothetical protein